MEKWDKSALAGAQSTPHSLHVPQGAEFIFKEKTGIDKQIPDINLGSARQVYLRAADFEARDKCISELQISKSMV